MTNFSIELVLPEHHEWVETIASWYLEEWNIAIETTRKKMEAHENIGVPFQLLLLADGVPVATGGVYTHVGLLDREPRFNIHPHWLALVYTVPAYRGKGLGAMLCKEIEQHAKKQGLNKLVLFTHTAESLYVRLGWGELERLEVGGRRIVIMQKTL